MILAYIFLSITSVMAVICSVGTVCTLYMGSYTTSVVLAVNTIVFIVETWFIIGMIRRLQHEFKDQNGL